MLEKVEKRKHQRYPLNVPVKMHPCGDDGISSVFEVSSRDISSRGVFIHLEEGLDTPLERVHLEMTLTIDKLTELFGCSKTVTLKVDGSVVRKFKDGLAVAFDRSYSISSSDY